jgi:hypothetical protein
MSPDSFNRTLNPSKEEFDRFSAWLFSHTLTELRAARGDMTATRRAWIYYFRQGLRADLLLDELMTHLPELFSRARYPEDEARGVLAIIKALNFSDMGIAPPETGAPFDEGLG